MSSSNAANAPLPSTSPAGQKSQAEPKHTARLPPLPTRSGPSRSSSMSRSEAPSEGPSSRQSSRLSKSNGSGRSAAGLRVSLAPLAPQASSNSMGAEVTAAASCLQLASTLAPALADLGASELSCSDVAGAARSRAASNAQQLQPSDQQDVPPQQAGPSVPLQKSASGVSMACTWPITTVGPECVIDRGVRRA